MRIFRFFIAKKIEISEFFLYMYPNDLNVMEAIWRSIRIYIVEKNGKLCDKFDRNIDLICEYDPQGMKMKIFTGEQNYNLFNFLRTSYVHCV